MNNNINVIFSIFQQAPNTETASNKTESDDRLPILSNGALLTICQGGNAKKPILQIIKMKKIQYSVSHSISVRYRVFISDGEYATSYAIMASRLNHLFDNNRLKDFSIICVDRFVCQDVNGKTVIVILDLQILSLGSEVMTTIGKPVQIAANGTISYNPTCAPVIEEDADCSKSSLSKNSSSDLSGSDAECSRYSVAQNSASDLSDSDDTKVPIPRSKSMSAAAIRMRERRSRETPAEREDRLLQKRILTKERNEYDSKCGDFVFREVDAMRKRISRSKETSAERDIRLEKRRNNRKRSSPEFRHQEAERKREEYRKKTPDQRKERLATMKCYNETKEVTKREREGMRERRAQSRANRTAVEVKKDNVKAKEGMAAIRANYTWDQIAQRAATEKRRHLDRWHETGLNQEQFQDHEKNCPLRQYRKLLTKGLDPGPVPLDTNGELFKCDVCDNED